MPLQLAHFRLKLAASLQRFARTLHSDRGSAAVPFILALPIFLLIVAILVQYAIIVNAKLLVDHAAQAAARAAVTSLPEGHPENVRSAAYMGMAMVSPTAKTAATPEADAVYQALQTVGVPVTSNFPARYTYAAEATDVDWTEPVDLTLSRARPVDVTVTYRLYLTVPGAMRVIGSADTIAGVHGRFLTIASTTRVEMSHSRKAAAGGGGWPQ